MKRIVIISVLALFAMLMVSSLSATAGGWLSTRDTVEVTAGTVDFTVYSNHTGALYYNFTVEFPCAFDELIGMSDPVINITATNATYGLTYSIDCNGESIVSSGVIVGINSHTKIYTDIADNIPDNTTTVLIFNVSCNVTNNTVNLYFTGDDMNVTSAQLASHIVYLEKDETDLMVKELGQNRWTVNDSINGTNDFGYDLTDCNFSLVYPASASGSHGIEYMTGDIPNGTTMTYNVVYQKDSPYFDEDTDIDSISGSVTVTVYANEHEDLKDVGWELDPSEYTAFAGLSSADTLTITMDTKDTDWKWKNDNILFSSKLDFDEDESYVFTFSWAGATGGEAGTMPVTPTAPANWYEQPVYGFPVWLIIGVFAIIVVVLYFASSGKGKKKRK